MERRRLQARGLVFDVLAAGDPAGEPVLLLHGFPQTAACWTRLAGPLLAHLRQWRTGRAAGQGCGS